MRSLLSGLSAIAVLVLTIVTGIPGPAGAQSGQQGGSSRKSEVSGKPSAGPAKSKRPTTIVNRPPPRNGAYYKGIFRD